MSRVVRNIIALLFIVLLLSTGSAATHHHAFRRSFHCYRPFDSLSSFSIAAMKPTDNCRLDYHRVIDAAVQVDCYAHGRRYATSTSGDEAIHGKLADRFGPLPYPNGVPVANGGSDRADVIAKNPPDDRDGCYATMFVKSVPDTGFGDRGSASDDSARYGVKLHTNGGGVVHYKGMDGVGYSVCCMFLNQPTYSRCEWQNHTHAPPPASIEGAGGEEKPHLDQVVQFCALEGQSGGKSNSGDGSNDDSLVVGEGEDPLGILGLDDAKQKKEGSASADDVDAAVIGYVTKPLHRNIAGTWSMEMLFYRGHDAVGKVVSDFNVTEAMLNPPSDNHHHHDHDHHSHDGHAYDAAAKVDAPPHDAVKGGEVVGKKEDGKEEAKNKKEYSAAVVMARRNDADDASDANGNSQPPQLTSERQQRKKPHHGREHHKERHGKKRHHKHGHRSLDDSPIGAKEDGDEVLSE